MTALERLIAQNPRLPMALFCVAVLVLQGSTLYALYSVKDQILDIRVQAEIIRDQMCGGGERYERACNVDLTEATIKALRAK